MTAEATKNKSSDDFNFWYSIPKFLIYCVLKSLSQGHQINKLKKSFLISVLLNVLLINISSKIEYFLLKNFLLPFIILKS